jgi:Iodothyronine deiodinase
MESNDQAGIAVKQPKDKAERCSVARTCCKSLGITMPMVVDDLDDHVGHLYSGMPDRLYVLDRQGRVAYKSGRGPFGFLPGEMEQALVMTLLDEAGEKSNGSAPANHSDKAESGRVP